MTVVHAFPSQGGVLFDVRDDGRALRVSWHSDQGIVVLSTWRHDSCTSTCHIARADIPVLVTELVTGLAATPDQPWAEPTYVDFSGGAVARQFRLHWPRLVHWRHSKGPSRPG